MHPTDGPPAGTRGQLALTFVGTATTLLRYRPPGATGAGITLLTDPNFLHRGQYASLGAGLVSRRLTEPALAPADLPPLDAVLLSHLHGDHFDRVAGRALPATVPVVTTPHARRRLTGRRWGFQDVTGLRTWQDTALSAGGARVRITAAPGRHAPGPFRALLPPVMGSLLEFGPERGPVDLTVYVTGDTLNVPELAEVPRRYPDVDLAVLHLGGTRVPGGLRAGLLVTMDAVQGADLLDLVRPRRAVPVHLDDYGVFASPPAAFRAEVARRGLGDVVRWVAPGETATFRGSP